MSSLEPKPGSKVFSSNQRNFVILYCRLLPLATTALRELFRSTWQRGKTNKWRNNASQGEIFLSKMGKQVLIETSTNQKERLVSGNVDMWNLKLLCHVLQKMDFGKANLKKDDKKKLQLLEEARCEIARCPNQAYTNLEFSRLWETIEKILVHFGQSASDLCSMKFSAFINQPFDLNVTNDHVKQIESDFLKEGKFQEAIVKYNELLILRRVYIESGQQKKASKYLTIAKVLEECNCLMKQKMKCSAGNFSREEEKLGEPDELSLSEEPADQEQLEILKMQACEWLAKKGDPKGLYVLATMHANGQGGLEKNLVAAVKLWKEAATKPPFINGKPNHGVADAEHALACYYEFGLGGLMISKKKAANLFARAVEHGHTASAINLARMYFVGNGVERNYRKAVEYWQTAASQGNTSAMQSLADYYLREVKDPNKAMEWHRKAMAGGKVSIDTNAQFTSDVKRLREKLQGLDLEACQTEKEDTQPFKREIKKKPKKSKKSSEPEITPHLDSTSTHRYNLDVLETHVLKGSVTAELLKRAVLHFDTALKILNEHKIKCPLNFINELADCIRIDHSVASWSPSEFELGSRVVADALKKSDKEVSELDKNVRICHYYFHANSFPNMKVFLTECMDKYPEEITFRIMLTLTLAYLSEYEQGIKVADEALDMFPENGELLFYKATHVRSLPLDLNSIVECYQRFIDAVPEDHCKVPEAYYTMAYECLNAEVSDVVNYYLMGLKKEIVQLPCFLPNNDCLKSELEEKMKIEPFKTVLEKFSQVMNKQSK
uniref:Uncharacterized protein n=1 Tax=Strigamia maritima TaxID=126957 RepID=T1IM73_STRMM